MCVHDNDYRDLTNLVEHLTWPTGHHKLNNINKDDSYRYSPTICSHGRGKALIPLQTRVSTDQVNDLLMIYTRDYSIHAAVTLVDHTNTCQCIGRKHNATATFSGWWTPKMKSKVQTYNQIHVHVYMHTRVMETDTWGNAVSASILLKSTTLDNELQKCSLWRGRIPLGQPWIKVAGLFVARITSTRAVLDRSKTKVV